MPKDPKDDLDPIRLGAETPEQFGALAEALADRRRDPGHLVVLARHLELPPEKSIAAFAKAMEYDAYTARQRLLAPTPRVLRRETNRQDAERWVGWLRDIGLRAFELSEEELAQQKTTGVQCLEMTEKGLLLEMAGGAPQEVPRADVIALVIGETSERTRVQGGTGSLLKGNAPAGREESSIHLEVFIDIHRRSTATIPRVAQDRFEFSRVYPDATGASAVLVRTLAKSLARHLPAAMVYDDFKQAADILGATRQLLSNSSYLERHWFTPGMRVRQERIVQDSTAATFDVYSLLARFEVLRSG